VLHNLRTDTKVLEFRNASGVGMTSDVSLVNDRSSSATTAGGACTAITFRTGELRTLLQHSNAGQHAHGMLCSLLRQHDQ
jgi:hypothetical protein